MVSLEKLRNEGAKLQDLDWNDLCHVLAISREGTLAGAARRLRINESTAGRHLARAERKLGAQLFERSQGRLHPTAAGLTAIATAERVERDVQAMAARLSGADRLAAGKVRVTAVPILVNRMLVPALPALFASHPQLEIDLIAEPRDLSLTRREADIALRLARPQRELRAVARRIGRLDYAVYALSGRDPARLPWIGYEDSMADLPQSRFIAERLARDGQDTAAIAVNDAEGVLAAVTAGLGKSLLPTAVAEDLPGLARLEGDGIALSRELWLMLHPDMRDLARIRAVTDWLIGLFGEPAGGLSPRATDGRAGT